MEKLRWGIIGAGGIADRRTIPGLMLAKNAELIAVMDIDPDHTEALRKNLEKKTMRDKTRHLENEKLKSKN